MWSHLISIEGAFDHPVTRVALGVAAAGIVGTPVVLWGLGAVGVVSRETRLDVWARFRAWMLLIPALAVPILLGPAATMALVCGLSLLCQREYARATGLFRHRALSGIVVLGILALTFASLDNWYNLFVSITPLTITVLAAGAVLPDEPAGYIQRVSLAAVGYLLMGAGLGHLAFMANDPEYRPILFMLLLCVQLSDIFAYICGRTFGRRRLFPRTSPKKTLGGHLGALVVVAPLAAWLAHLVFRGTRMDHPALLALFGLMVAVGAQLGDLVLGSIKRDIGIKEMASTLPGHGGGFLDRFNSLLLVAPAAFHFIKFFVGIGGDRLPRVFTGL